MNTRLRAAAMPAVLLATLGLGGCTTELETEARSEPRWNVLLILADDRPDKADEMLRKLRAWQQAVGAQEMEPNPGYDPKRAGDKR